MAVCRILVPAQGGGNGLYPTTLVGHDRVGAPCGRRIRSRSSRFASSFPLGLLLPRIFVNLSFTVPDTDWPLTSAKHIWMHALRLEAHRTFIMNRSRRPRRRFTEGMFFWEEGGGLRTWGWVLIE